jgi:hypothetical protein
MRPGDLQIRTRRREEERGFSSRLASRFRALAFVLDLWIRREIAQACGQRTPGPMKIPPDRL